MDKVRRIVHAKLRPFRFQITTYYLTDADYPTDNSSQTDKSVSSLKTAIVIQHSTERVPRVNTKRTISQHSFATNLILYFEVKSTF